MPSQVISSVENNFTKGLITESTGMNFPENAATETFNCEYTLIGDVLRREGIDFEVNHRSITVDRTSKAISCYKWNNAGGDGDTQILVLQVGSILYFYNSGSATQLNPVSNQLLSTTVDMSSFASVSGSYDTNIENTYADGNGFLFVFNSNADPVCCTYTSGSVVGSKINVQIRDFQGVVETVDVNFRPTSLTTAHTYNLLNQGWTSGSPWYGSSSNALNIAYGQVSWTIQTGFTIPNGTVVRIRGNIPGSSLYTDAVGTVTAYSTSTGQLTLNVFSVITNGTFNTTWTVWNFTPISAGYLNSWFTAEGNYPSNADVWWYFKDNTGAFNPALTQPNVTLAQGNAPQGHYILNAWNQDRTATTGISSLTPVKTNLRPTVGAWFQGRVWYSGVSDTQQAAGNAAFYTWSENIYFSQVNLSSNDSFGKCYQENDPTSENLFDLLPTDGGVIQIQGSGRIHKLFPVQNGMLVFAANGVWFITGSQGIGFSATDYTITKISSVEALSAYSFVDVLGMPYFWNEEGIYSVQPTQGGQLEVNAITVGTILSFYSDIPTLSKKYARGAYDPIEYTIKWVYKSTLESSVKNRYSFDGILNFNVYNKAFYPYLVDNVTGSINSVVYIQTPTNSNAVNAVSAGIRYFASIGNTLSIADEHDLTYKDWSSSGTPVDYTSYFITGYKLHGKAQQRFQIPYIYVYSRVTDGTANYKIQGIWDYAISGDTGRWSTAEVATINLSNQYSVKQKRHRVRGRGLVLQIKISSVSGKPFDIIGWSVYENVNTGV